MMVKKARKMRTVRKTGRVRRAAVLPVGSKGGAGRQGTVHTRVSSVANGSYHLCSGEISWSWHHFRAGEEGRTEGLIFWESEPRETALGWCVCCLCVHHGGKLQRQKSPSNW